MLDTGFTVRFRRVPGLSLADAQAKLTLWMAADDAVAQGQSYTIQGTSGARSLTRINADEIRKNITFWSAIVARLDRGGIGLQRAVPE